MINQQHLITPPPDLLRKWSAEAVSATVCLERYIATQAARWGADQELEACCEWLRSNSSPELHVVVDAFRAARRPKPPSLKEQSLALIDKIQGNKEMWLTEELDVVRRALEQLEVQA